MLSVSEIKNVKFSSSMSGYKKDEVDIFLDKVEADYEQFDKMVNDFQEKIDALNNEINDYKSAQDSIQNVLLSAQKLADRIVNEAKEKSEEIIKNAESNISVITTREKELSTTFELKAQERKATLEKELKEMVESAEAKAKAITAAADDSVRRQQVLFDKLKMEIATFKSEITSKYKEHLEILSTIPDTVPSEPTRVAEIMSTAIDKEPDILKFLKPEPIVKVADPIILEDAQSKSEGFKIESLDENEEES